MKKQNVQAGCLGVSGRTRGLSRSDVLVWVGLVLAGVAAIAWAFVKGTGAKGGRGDGPREILAQAAGEDVHLARLKREVGAFELTDQRGQAFSSDALKGKFWVADFIFTTCPGPCPVMTGNMARLQESLSDIGADRVHFVSFTCDPFRDRPEVLSAYAQQFGAETENWSFLTGAYGEIQRIAREGFVIPVLNSVNAADAAAITAMESQASDSAAHVGNVIHSPHFILVGPDGRTVGWYIGSSSAELALLEADVRRLEGRARLIQLLPAVNAALNTTATALLLSALYFIKRKNRSIEAHRWSIVAAVSVSALFLTSYVIYHTQRITVTGETHTRWEVEGFWRPTYYAVLVSHVVLAAIVPLLALWTLYLGWTRQDARHRRMAKVTFPIWLYVSVTGVVVYFMLYHLHPVLLGGG